MRLFARDPSKREVQEESACFMLTRLSKERERKDMKVKGTKIRQTLSLVLGKISRRRRDDGFSFSVSGLLRINTEPNGPTNGCI